MAKWGVIVGSATGVSAIIALATAAPVFWNDYGWITPAQHEQDLTAAGDDIREFRDEWKCDEYEEELVELLKRQQAGDDSVELKRLIERIREKMDDIDCSRFEDF